MFPSVFDGLVIRVTDTYDPGMNRIDNARDNDLEFICVAINEQIDQLDINSAIRTRQQRQLAALMAMRAEIVNHMRRARDNQSAVQQESTSVMEDVVAMEDESIGDNTQGAPTADDKQDTATADKVKSHLHKFGIEVRDVFILSSKIQGTKSAKVRVAREHRDRAKSPEIWPQHCKIADWVNFKRKSRPVGAIGNDNGSI